MTNVDNSNKLKCFTRTRGGDPREKSFKWWALLFYPHTRGWSSFSSAILINSLVLPAHAGVIPNLSKAIKNPNRFTRTRGGDPKFMLWKWKDCTFYPHTRGWSFGQRAQCQQRWVLPAHAGVIPIITLIF